MKQTNHTTQDYINLVETFGTKAELWPEQYQKEFNEIQTLLLPQNSERGLNDLKKVWEEQKMLDEFYTELPFSVHRDFIDHIVESNQAIDQITWGQSIRNLFNVLFPFEERKLSLSITSLCLMVGLFLSWNVLGTNNPINIISMDWLNPVENRNLSNTELTEEDVVESILSGELWDLSQN